MTFRTRPLFGKYLINPSHILCCRSISTISDQPILRVPKSSIYALGAGSSSKPLFHDISWTIHPKDAWIVVSVGSTSGKTSLLRALLGHLRIHPAPPPPYGLFPFLNNRDPHKHVSLVSFAHRPRAAGGGFVDFTARYGAVREEDKRTLRDTFFPETARPIHDLAFPEMHSSVPTLLETSLDISKERKRRLLFEYLVENLDLRRFLELPLIALSNGQTRKARILKALLEQPELLILDEPLTGLDVQTRKLLLSLLEELHRAPEPPHIIMGSRIQDPIPDWTTHLAIIHKDGTVQTGPKEDLMPTITSHQTSSSQTTSHQHAIKRDLDRVLIDMQDLNVAYGDRKVLKNIRWTIHANSRWHLLGANGAGKTTLLAMLTGEHPQSYTQSSKLHLFSRPRSKWPTPYLHAQIGRVSPELHNAFPRRKGLSVWDAIGTAFNNNFMPRGRRRVGLASDGSELEEGGQVEQWRLTRMWHVLEGLGPIAWNSDNSKKQTTLQAFADRQFADLSPGEQSIVLLMRALVTRPPLVLLDEAWAGMDEGMVKAARTYLREGGGLEDGQACIVVTHWEDEVPWGWEDGVRRFQLVNGEGKELQKVQ
ncbi:hypothetical protein QCA50_005355 [Cerrena zonata]|uniref:ABC transporter domain-containing protein n=1 Tax=Cerrena zonata TaxID=2478898 RepID=A0AAW0GF50_9APHY